MIDNSPVIDFHGHVGRMDEFLAWDDPELMLHAMDAVGIDQSCVFNVWHPHGTGGNDRTAAFVARHPDRFIGFAYVSPTVPGGMVEELTRAVDELGMRAIKIYPPFGSYPLDHAAWDPIYAFTPNYFLETCSTFRTPGVIEQLVEGAGADRVLYGSDIPLMDPRAQIGKIITAEIDEEAKKLVLGGNARRLLQL